MNYQHWRHSYRETLHTIWNTDDIKTFWEQSNLYFFLDNLFFLFFCFLSSFSFHSFNLACRNPSCTHSIPGQRPDRWFLRKKIIHLCVIALALDTNAKIIMMKTTKRARTTPLAMIASLPSNISTEDLKNISPGGPPVRKMATEEGWYGMVFLGPELHWYCRSDPEWRARHCWNIIKLKIWKIGCCNAGYLNVFF